MIFVHPEFLYLMFPALIMLFYFLLTGKEQQYHFFSPEVLERLQVTSNTLGMRGRNALFFLIFSLLIVALAQPVIEDGKVKVKAKSADIMVAVDISDSMLAQDVFPTRLEAAKKKVLDLLGEAPKERIGIMAFAKDAYLVSPLSFDHRAVRFLLKQLNTGSITEKGTDFSGLIRSASEALKTNENRYLLLLTDGGDKEDFSKEIALAKKEGIKIFILALGSEQGAPVKLPDGGFVKKAGKIIVSKRNDSIKSLAFDTGGAYVESVTSSDDIRAMLSEIHSKTVRKELKEEEVVLYIALFYYPLGLALLLLLIATSSMSKRVSVGVPHLFIVAFLALHVSDVQAGLLDFRLLDDAQKSYEAGDYNRSSKLYGEYLSNHPSAQTHYNRANADYKMGRYDAAIKGYEQIHSADSNFQHDTLYNMGNAYAKKGDMESLQKAVESYEEALKLKEDADTQANLEAVKKAIEQMKQQQQEQQNKQDQNKQQSKDSQNSGDDDNKTQEPSQDDQKQEQNGDENPNHNKKENDQKSEQKPEQNPKQNEDNNTSDEPKQDAQNSADQNRSQEEQKSEGQPEQKDQEAHDRNATATAAEPNPLMSEREAQKWLQLMQQDQGGHLYQLNRNESNKEQNPNENPW